MSAETASSFPNGLYVNFRAELEPPDQVRQQWFVSCDYWSDGTQKKKVHEGESLSMNIDSIRHIRANGLRAHASHFLITLLPEILIDWEHAQLSKFQIPRLLTWILVFTSLKIPSALRIGTSDA